MSEPNLGARRLLAHELEQLSEEWSRLDQRRRSLLTQTNRNHARQKEAAEAMASIQTALDALGGRPPEEEEATE